MARMNAESIHEGGTFQIEGDRLSVYPPSPSMPRLDFNGVPILTILDSDGVLSVKADNAEGSAIKS
jgi:hypothetical protein